MDRISGIYPVDLTQRKKGLDEAARQLSYIRNGSFLYETGRVARSLSGLMASHNLSKEEVEARAYELGLIHREISFLDLTPIQMMGEVGARLRHCVGRFLTNAPFSPPFRTKAFRHGMLDGADKKAV